MAAVAAAPTMLCYVTRPDAVLMEVEVEAKANGEDCLNQVRAVIGKGIPACPEKASELGDAPREPGDVAAAARGALPGRQAPASSFPRACVCVWGGAHRGRLRWGIRGLETRTLQGTSTLSASLALFSKEGGPAHLPQVCVMPPVESLQSPAAPPASRDEVAANGRWPGGSLADQVGPVSEAASQKDCSPDIPGSLGIQSILSNLRFCRPVSCLGSLQVCFIKGD